MPLFAISEAGLAIGAICFFFCLALMVHAFLPQSPKGQVTKPPPWRSIAFRAVVECAAIWVWLVPSFFLIAWAAWIGDNWRSEYDPILHGVAGTFAVIISAVVAVRSRKRSVTYGFLRFHLWVPVGLLLGFGVLNGFESLRRIEGLTSESAAQNVFDRITRRMTDPVQFVEEKNQTSGRCKTYVIMADEEPRGRFTICRHPWFGWQFASNFLYGPSQPRLEKAKASFNVAELRSIVEDYRGYRAADEARKFLEAAGVSPSE